MTLALFVHRSYASQALGHPENDVDLTDAACYIQSDDSPSSYAKGMFSHSARKDMRCYGSQPCGH